MRFKRTLAVAMGSAVAAAGSVASVGLSAAPAQAATTTVALPISQFSHMLVDPVHQHLFISSAASNSILVTDYSGQTVATIANESGADGLALSSDGTTVYAALTTGDAISAISTSTLTETARYATGTGTDPTYVAYTGGKIWFGYGAAGATGPTGIGSVDPSISPAAVTLNATNDPPNTWNSAPILASSPNGELVAGQPLLIGIRMASYDVSAGSVAAPAYGFLNASVLESLQITPDGQDVVVASDSPDYHQILQVSDLSEVGEYPTTTAPTGLGTASAPDAVSIASDGTVAAGVGKGNTNEVFVFASGGSTPLNTYSFGPTKIGASNSLASDGVAITPDGSDLFAITGINLLGSQPILHIIPNPEQAASTLSVTGPATAGKREAITLTGALGGTSNYVGGQTLQVTRIDPADPDGIALPDVTTAANGSFSFTDTPPNANADTATVTYTVSYAGDAHLTASTATVSVKVRYNNS
jgi:hypothetical protein